MNIKARVVWFWKGLLLLVDREFTKLSSMVFDYFIDKFARITKQRAYTSLLCTGETNRVDYAKRYVSFI